MSEKKWEITVSIILGVLTLLGTSSIVMSGMHSQFTEPLIMVEIKEERQEKDSRSMLIDIVNMGISPATNISLIIDPSAKVQSISNIISTSNITIREPNMKNDQLISKQVATTIESPIIILYIPKLVEGDGSRILLEVIINDFKAPYNSHKAFNVYAVYDQGSKKGTFADFIGMDFESTGIMFSKFVQSYSYIIIILLLPVVVWIIYLIMRHRNSIPDIFSRKRISIWYGSSKPVDSLGYKGDIVFNLNPIRSNPKLNCVGWLRTDDSNDLWKPFGSIQ